MSQLDPISSSIHPSWNDSKKKKKENKTKNPPLPPNPPTPRKRAEKKESGRKEITVVESWPIVVTSAGKGSENVLEKEERNAFFVRDY